MIASIIILVVGAASALVYLFKRAWLDAALVLIAALALSGLVGEVSLPGAVQENAMRPEGNGLRAAQWHDLPARPIIWRAPDGDVLHLDFPRSISQGRMFHVTASLPTGAARRLQLLAENGQVLAEASGTGTSLTVNWMPPLAETLVLKARLLDANGKSVAEGPVPVEVRSAVPLVVQGRFSAPSFDARTLNQLLAQSNALLDWQIKLGKTLERSETAREPILRKDLMVLDAGYFERLGAASRTALLAEVATGMRLVVLGASAAEPALWSRTLQLELREQPEAKPGPGPLVLASVTYGAARSALWKETGDRIWTRQWEQGSVTWVGVGEWHRYAISEPRALGLWWQDVLDNARVRRSQEVAILDPEEMPLPRHRLELCAQGASGEVTFPQLKQTMAWQRRPDKADAVCVAVWPTASGWLTFEWGGAKPQQAQIYVYAKNDWPLWQKAQKRDATLRYAARTPEALKPAPVPLPAWPFALLFIASMLLLWWRERR